MSAPHSLATLYKGNADFEQVDAQASNVIDKPATNRTEVLSRGHLLISINLCNVYISSIVTRSAGSTEAVQWGTSYL